jgi:xylulokinase
VDLVLGVDIGTGTTKAVIADGAGKVLWTAVCSYEFSRPRPGYAEQDPDDWWRAFCTVTRRLLDDHPEARGSLRAVSASGQGAAAVLLDSHGRAVRRAILWLDQRSAAFAEALDQRCGDQISSISGKAPGTYNVEPKLLWILQNESDVWARTWKVFSATSFITYRLTGEPVMNHSDAGVQLGYDLGRGEWSRRLLEEMGLPIAVYPTLAPSDAVVGYVNERAADDSGLPRGLAVVAGGEDTSSAGLAMGAISSEDGQLSLGTANTVYVPSERPISHPRLLSFPHVISGWTLVGGSIAAGGLATQWISKILGGNAGSSKSNLLEQLTEEAGRVDCGSGGLVFLPYLAGELQPINDGFARGVFFGLTAEMERGHLMRSVFEGNAFAIEHNLSLARMVGAQPKRLWAVGGPTRNKLLCQIIADVTGAAVTVVDERGGAALGSAMLAAKGAGIIGDYSEMQRAHSRITAKYETDAEPQSRYQANFKTYVELYPRIAGLYPRNKTGEAAADVHL